MMTHSYSLPPHPRVSQSHPVTAQVPHQASIVTTLHYSAKTAPGSLVSSRCPEAPSQEDQEQKQEQEQVTFKEAT
jgi:hypothetical protein